MVILIISCIVSFSLGWILHRMLVIIGLTSMISEGDGKFKITIDEDNVFFNGKKVD